MCTPKSLPPAHVLDELERLERFPSIHARADWRKQAFPVLLVIRTSDGEVRWMEIRDYLRRAGGDGKKAVKQIVFEGERFDVTSVRRWREKELSR